MKYRTIIEVICDASGPDDAVDIAGDYLRGEVDFGVQMNTNTVSVRAHKVRKYAITCIAMLVVFSAIFVKVMPLNHNVTERTGAAPAISSYTVMPSLKTKDGDQFRKQWEKKKDQAVLDYIKN